MACIGYGRQQHSTRFIDSEEGRHQCGCRIRPMQTSNPVVLAVGSGALWPKPNGARGSWQWCIPFGKGDESADRCYQWVGTALLAVRACVLRIACARLDGCTGRINGRCEPRVRPSLLHRLPYPSRRKEDLDRRGSTMSWTGPGTEDLRRLRLSAYSVQDSVRLQT